MSYVRRFYCSGLFCLGGAGLMALNLTSCGDGTSTFTSTEVSRSSGAGAESGDAQGIVSSGTQPDGSTSATSGGTVDAGDSQDGSDGSLSGEDRGTGDATETADDGTAIGGLAPTDGIPDGEGDSSSPVGGDGSAASGDDGGETSGSDLVYDSEVLASTCENAIAGDMTQVIALSGQETEVELQPDSIVFLRTSGNANVVLKAGSAASIQGICIEAAGGSSLTFETELIVGGIFVDAGGESSVTIDFGRDGELTGLISDARGSASMDIYGDMIDCSSLSVQISGQPDITCNGEML